MSIHRRGLYSVEDMQIFMFENKYKQEMDCYHIRTSPQNEFDVGLVEDNLINTANFVLLLGIDRFVHNFIDDRELKLLYQRILVYTENYDLLGEAKVFCKIMDLANSLYCDPFVAVKL